MRQLDGDLVGFYNLYAKPKKLSPRQDLLALRLRVKTALDGVTRPVDEQQADRLRADRLRALTADALEDRAAARPSDPPSWVEPPAFLYHVEIATRLAGRHFDYG